MLLEKYKNSKDHYLLNFISLFAESYYNDLSLKNPSNFYLYFISRNKIINLINDMKKFNLEKNNLIISIKKVLENEEK